MPNSLMDFGEIGRLAMGIQSLQQQQRHNDLIESSQQIDRDRLEQQDRQIRQNAVFKAYDEMDKLSNSPAFASPQQQVALRYQQANLIKMGLGVDIPTPSQEEMLGNSEQFAENLRMFRNGADPEARQAAFERMAISMPDFGHKVLTTIKQSNDLNIQNEELLTKLELNKAKLQALNVKSGRTAMQQGLFSENMGAIAQTVQLANSPRFQGHLQKLQGMTPLARQAYLNMNPQFQKEFTEAMKPHLDKLGALGPEYEEALGDDVKPRFLSALDDQIDAGLQAKNEATERDGVAPTELGEELAGLDLVRKARTVQYAWMRDPFDKDKFKAMQKAQQDLRIAYDAKGKTLASIQNDRNAIAQTKFDAGQQTQLAEDYSQQQFKQALVDGHNENEAAVIAGKATNEKYPGVPYNAEKLKVSGPMVVNNNQQKVIDNTDKALGANMADKIATQIDTSYKAAINAGDIMDGVNRIRTALNSGKVTLGPGATFRNSVNQVAQMLGIGGKDNAERLSNTRTVIQDLARFTVKARTQLRGEGQITEGEQKVLAKAESGDIDDFTMPDFKTFLSTTEKIARKTDARHQKMLEKARANPAARHLAPFYEIDPLPAAQPDRVVSQNQQQSNTTRGSKAAPAPQSLPTIKGDADFNKLPSGAIFIGPDGKKRRKP